MKTMANTAAPLADDEMSELQRRIMRKASDGLGFCPQEDWPKLGWWITIPIIGIVGRLAVWLALRRLYRHGMVIDGTDLSGTRQVFYAKGDAR